jgi:hypothetical protein
VIGDARLIDDGQIVTAAGITAGLDLGLWLVQRYRGPGAATGAAAQLEYTRTGYDWRRPPRSRPTWSSRRPRWSKWPPSWPGPPNLTSLYNRSVRSYLFARVAAAARGLAAGDGYDDEPLFPELHPARRRPHHAGGPGRRFEVDGAEAVVDLLRANGLEAARAQIVWDAIALHTSAGIAGHRKRGRAHPLRDRLVDLM